MWNLRNRLLIPILSVALFGLSIATYTSYTMSRNALQTALTSNAEGAVKDLAGVIRLALQGAQAELTTFANAALTASIVTHSVKDNDAAVKILNAQLRTIQTTHTYYQSVTLADGDGVVVASSNLAGVGGKRGDRDYFKAIMAGRLDYLSAPMISRSAAVETPVVVKAVPVLVEGKASGVVIAAIDLKKFSDEFVEPKQLAADGYAFIVTNEGVVVAHKKSEHIMDERMAAVPAVRRILQEKADHNVFTAELNGVPAMYFYQREPTSSWCVIMRADVDDMLHNVHTLRTVSIGIALATLFGIAFVVFLVVRNVAGAISQGLSFAQAVAGGNLGERLDVRRGDEIGRLADALRTMVEKLRQMIATAEQKSEEAREQTEKAAAAVRQAEEAQKVAEQAKSEGMRQAGSRLSVIANKVNVSARELVTQVNQAQNGAATQRNRTMETAAAMGEMTTTVADVARSAGSAAESAEGAKNNAEQGAKAVADLVGAINEVDGKTSGLKSSLNRLGEQAQSIGRIMSVISDIADQTNLLALNAAIEAARAGDAGRGFAVVADEVRKLAEKTMQATREVGDAVKAIQDGTNQNIQGIEEAAVSVSRSTEIACEAGRSLAAIVSIAEDTADKVRSIATASEEQSASSEEINKGTEEISRIADQTSDLMNQAHDAVTHLSSLVGEIEALVRELEKA